MSSFKSEPFLWIHLAGLVVVPLALSALWLGLAIGDPLPFFWLELLVLIAVGVLPILWMQWSRPFDIFSILILAIKPDKLTSEQRQILSRFKTNKQRTLTLIAALVMVGLLWELYQLAPLASIAAAFLPQSRFLGLLMAAIAFWACNLFVQVPVSVLGILSTSQQELAETDPYPTEKILQDFTAPGFQVDWILPLSVTGAKLDP